MPEGAIYVGRPTKWGNPFYHTQKFHGLDAALELYRLAVLGIWSPTRVDELCIKNPLIPYEAQQHWRKRFIGHPSEHVRSELRGFDLACWCPLDKPCHADILLEIANK